MEAEKKRVLVRNVPFISQLEQYPTGCESVSAVMALNRAGIPVTVDDFIDCCLPMAEAPRRGEDGVLHGPDPAEVFPGDPRTKGGWGCFVPAVVEAVSRLNRPELEVQPLLGESLDALCRWLDWDIPLLLWATIHMAPPHEFARWTAENGREIVWISPMHCLVLVGYDEDGFYFNDPIDGEGVFFPRPQVETAYEAQGRQALALYRKEEFLQ